MKDEGSTNSESDAYNSCMPLARESLVNIQRNNELVAPACPPSPGQLGMRNTTAIRPKETEPVSPLPCSFHEANGQCHLREANDQVMADIVSEIASSGCFGVSGQMPHMSTDSDVDTALIASDRMASREAPAKHHLPTRAPNPEPWKPSELAGKLIDSQQNLDDVTVAMLRAESGAAEQSNGSLMPASDRPQSPEP